MTERMAAPVGLRGRRPAIFCVGDIIIVDGEEEEEVVLVLVRVVNVWR